MNWLHNRTQRRVCSAPVFIIDIYISMIWRWKFKVLNFAYDTKLIGTVSGSDSAETLQNDLNALIRLTDQWQMNINVD